MKLRYRNGLGNCLSNAEIKPHFGSAKVYQCVIKKGREALDVQYMA